MRLRHLYRRTRPFRYAGLWALLPVWPLLALDASAPRSLAQWLTGLGFCAIWPLAADRWQRLAPADESRWRFDVAAYVAECLAVAAVLGWASPPHSAALALAVCLLAGAVALAGIPLLLAATVALALGGWVGIALAPRFTTASTAAADAVAAILIVGFALALGNSSFRQAQRLDRQRRILADRSADLQRLNVRMERYLPPSLRARLADAPEAPCRWERRWLSVAFVDLVGFTELSERLEAEPLAAILDDCLGGLTASAEAHGGEVSKLLGDGVLVVFGVRGEDDRRARAAAALAFCADLPALLARLASQWRSRGELVVLRSRAGIASGYCTLGDRGGADRLDFTLVGTPVNLASRLQARARADALLMDAATAALADGTIRLQAPRMLVLKGLGQVPAYAIAGPEARVDPPVPSAIVPARPAQRQSRDTDGTAEGRIAEGVPSGLPR